VAANVCAAHPSLGARIVAAWPALALLLVVEMLSRSGRTAEQPAIPAAEDAQEPPPELQAEPQQARLDRRPATTAGTAWNTAARPAAPIPVAGSSLHLPARQRHQPPPATLALVGSGAPAAAELSEQRVAADAAELTVARSHHHSATVPPQPTGTELARSAGRARDTTDRAGRSGTRRRPTAVTRQLANQIMAAQPQLTRGEIAERLGVSTRRLREVLATQP
jgi:hypothetical protein